MKQGYGLKHPTKNVLLSYYDETTCYLLSLYLLQSKQVVNQARRPPKNKQEFLKLAKSLLRIRQRSKQLEPKDPPRALVVPDLAANDSDLRLPTEFIYLLRLGNVWSCVTFYSI